MLAFAVFSVSFGNARIRWQELWLSYHFAATFVELFDRLVELLYGKRHSDAAAQDELLSLGLLQLTGGPRY